MNFKSVLKWIVPVVVLATSCSIDKLYKMKQNRKMNPYEQINFNEIVKLYFAKDKTSVGTIEGIYSVSSLITKKGKVLFLQAKGRRFNAIAGKKFPKVFVV